MFNNEALEYLKLCKTEICEKVGCDIYKNLWTIPSATKWLGSVLLKEELRPLKDEDLLEALKDKNNWKEDVLPKDSSLDWLSDKQLLNCLSHEPLHRYDMIKRISKLRKNEKISSDDIRRGIIEVFAWGGMQYNSARIALSCSYLSKYEEICRDLLSGMSAVDAYKKFYDAYHAKQITHIGPAYYTKLIFFFGDQTGVIMDQWTARSINELFEEKTVTLESKEYVTPKNDLDVYKKFLEKCEILRKELGVETLSEAEELIFSSHDSKIKKKHGRANRRICSAWRKYLKTGEKTLEES